jgi:hypothetical protein
VTRDSLHEAWTARPFRPFALHLPDGRSLDVPHPEFLSISPNGRLVVVYRGEGAHVVDLLLVSDLEYRRPRRRRRSA